MDIKAAVISQYHAALGMLHQAIEGCSDALWLDKSYANVSWNIAYHALFYTHLYLSSSEAAFTAWCGHRNYYHEFGNWPEPYTKTQVLEYLVFCLEMVDRQVEAIEMDTPSGFGWLPFSRLELHLYNIRHIMLHTGELAERLGAHGAVQVAWVARVSA
jgi:hypothetical protein